MAVWFFFWLAFRCWWTRPPFRTTPGSSTGDFYWTLPGTSSAKAQSWKTWHVTSYNRPRVLCNGNGLLNFSCEIVIIAEDMKWLVIYSIDYLPWKVYILLYGRCKELVKNHLWLPIAEPGHYFYCIKKLKVLLFHLALAWRSVVYSSQLHHLLRSSVYYYPVQAVRFLKPWLKNGQHHASCMSNTAWYFDSQLLWGS